MGTVPQIAEVWAVIRRHPGVSSVLAIMGAIATYDTFSGQVAQVTDRELPSLHKLFGQSVAVGGHLLPWWGWIIMLLVTLNIALLWQRRPMEASEPSPVEAEPPSGEPELEEVIGKHFARCRVEVGGKLFRHCTFDNVTFVFGVETTGFYGCRIGPFNIETTSGAAGSLMMLLINSGLCNIQVLANERVWSADEHRTAAGNQLMDVTPSHQGGAPSRPSPPDTEPETPR
jgi:hypothetical protein